MKNTNQSTAGTSFFNSTVSATLNQMCDILGEPIKGGIEDKVTHEWEKETSENQVFTVYDWKEFREIQGDELIDWHIGGKSLYATEVAKKEITEALLSLRVAKEEKKVYVIEADDEDIEFHNATEAEIIHHCEITGKIYSLKGFEESINNEELNLSNSFIRII